MLDRDQIAKPTGADDAVEGREEGCVPQHMGYMQAPGGATRSSEDPQRFRQRVSYGLFQQDIPTEIQSCNRRFCMMTIWGGDDADGFVPGVAECILPAGELPFQGDRMCVAKVASPLFIRFDHRHEPQSFRISCGVVTVDVSTALAGSHQDGAMRFPAHACGSVVGSGGGALTGL